MYEFDLGSVLLLTIASLLAVVFVVASVYLCVKNKLCCQTCHDRSYSEDPYIALQSDAAYYGTNEQEFALCDAVETGARKQSRPTQPADDAIELCPEKEKPFRITKTDRIKVLPNIQMQEERNFFRGGMVEFSLKYTDTLAIAVLSVSGLIVGDDLLDLYLIVKLYKLSPITRRKSLLNNVRLTRTQRGTSYTRFNQTLEFNIDKCLFKSLLEIQLNLIEVDEYSRHLVIGECFDEFIPERIHSPPLESKCHVIYKPLLQPQSVDTPRVQLSLCYLPLAEKLLVTIVEAKNFKGKNYGVCFGINLMTGRKSSKKSKTVIKPVSSKVSFGETLSFDLAYSHLSLTYLVVTCLEITNWTTTQKATSDKASIEVQQDSGGSTIKTSSEEEYLTTRSHALLNEKKGSLFSRHDKNLDSDQEHCILSDVLIKPKKIPIGRVYLGQMFSGRSRTHWNELSYNYRKQISCWHSLL